MIETSLCPPDVLPLLRLAVVYSGVRMLLILILSGRRSGVLACAVDSLSAEGSVPTTHAICPDICGRGLRWRSRGRDDVGFIMSSGCQSLVRVLAVCTLL